MVSLIFVVQRQNDKINIMPTLFLLTGKFENICIIIGLMLSMDVGGLGVWTGWLGSANVDTFRRFHITTTGTTPPPPPSLPTAAGRDDGVSVEQLPV